jgi:hypothetical protein
MRDLVANYILPIACHILPPQMHSPRATAMLMAIGLQESAFEHRRQLFNGPARGYWQFEEPAVRAVLKHERSAAPIAAAIKTLCYTTVQAALAEPLYMALEHNDILAACFARCLLWTDRRRLPGPNDHELAWEIYRDTWKPGRPRPNSWEGNYRVAWRIVGAEIPPAETTAT